MQPKTVAYPIILIVELIRLFMILLTTSQTVRGSLIWYAGVPLLCAAPVLWLLLSLDETRFTLWLPLIVLLKSLSTASFAVFSLLLLPNALAFGTSGGDNPAALLPAASLLVLVDSVLGIYAYGRYRVLCK